MLLERLVEYAERVKLPPPMYQNTPIRWVIELDAQGSFLGFISTAGEEKRTQRGKEFTAPHALATSGTTPKLLVGSAEYIFGFEEKSSKRGRERHQAFVELVRECVEKTGELSIRTILGFLQNPSLKTMPLPDKFNSAHTFTFRVGGVLPIHLPSVQRFWAERTQQKQKAPVGKIECLVCGKLSIPLERHPVQIKGIPGRQRSGMALISVNEDAFESYGLSASLTAPMCLTCAQSYANAANALIRDDNSHITIDPLVYIFWTREENPFSPASLLSHPEPEDVKALIGSVYSGRETATRIDTTPFYATAFSASGGRVVVRDWVDTTVDDARRSLARYFVLQNIVDAYGGEGRPLSLRDLADATVPWRNNRPDRKQLNPNVCRVLLRLAFEQEPLPMWLLYQAVHRNRAEQGPTRPRAALIKMVLLSQDKNLLRREQWNNLTKAIVTLRTFADGS